MRSSARGWYQLVRLCVRQSGVGGVLAVPHRGRALLYLDIGDVDDDVSPGLQMLGLLVDQLPNLVVQIPASQEVLQDRADPFRRRFKCVVDGGKEARVGGDDGVFRRGRRSRSR